MNKRRLHHIWTKIRPISYWYFLVLAVVFGVIAVFALRQNNLNAVRLRENVNKVDEQNGDVELALRQLREYVYSHMNTDLSSGTSIQQPVQLKYRYERLVAAENERVNAANSKVYTEAQAICEQRFPASRSGGPRVPCIEEYVTTHGVKPQPIPEALYKFSFTPPRWSPDLAGFSIVLFFLFLGLFIIRLAFDQIVKYILKQHL